MEISLQEEEGTSSRVSEEEGPEAPPRVLGPMHSAQRSWTVFSLSNFCLCSVFKGVSVWRAQELGNKSSHGYSNFLEVRREFLSLVRSLYRAQATRLHYKQLAIILQVIRTPRPEKEIQRSFIKVFLCAHSRRLSKGYNTMDILD